MQQITFAGRRSRRRIAQARRAGEPLTAVLRLPNVIPVATASFVARLPRGMASLAVVLLVHQATASYATAGAAAGAMALANATSAPIGGRLIDRLDQRRVLFPSAAMYFVSLVCLVLTADRLSATLVIATAAVAGLAYPPISASMKTLWPILVPRESLHTAYAIESLMQQTFFLIGPLLVAALVAVGSPAAAVLATAALGFVGTIAFVVSAASRGWRGDHTSGPRAGALASSAVQLIVAVTFAQSIVFGALYVAVPAFASEHGEANAAGVLLGVMNVGALGGGLVAVSRPPSADAVARYRRLTTLTAVSVAPIMVAQSIPMMGLLLAGAGVFIAPAAAASYVLLDVVSPRACRTEAFTWMTTAVAAGGALGSAAGGSVIDNYGVGASLVLAALSCAAGALALTAKCDLLRGTTAGRETGA
jgi:predicted MFS family arabinose efflux permease